MHSCCWRQVHEAAVRAAPVHARQAAATGWRARGAELRLTGCVAVPSGAAQGGRVAAVGSQERGHGWG